MIINRRNFLKGLGSTFALSAIPGVNSYAYNPFCLNNPNKEIFVFVFLRGGCDALNLVAPMGDRFYADSRTAALRVPENPNFILDNGLDGYDFNIHPKAQALKEIYDSGDMAIVHASGLNNGTRSHFEAMDLIERGLIKKEGNAKGWMTRYFETLKSTSILPAVAVGNGLPSSFLGCPEVTSIDSVKDFKVLGEPYMKQILSDFYKGDTLLHNVGHKTLKTIDSIQNRVSKKHNGNVEDYHPEHNVKYPDEWYINGFSRSLQNLARLIKMDLGVHIATVEFDDWDHHERQEYRFPQRIEGLSNSLAAFYNDMSNFHNRMTIVVMSEFGRRLKSNRSGGTDHGHGGLSFILGGKVKGGRMYGEWPGLATHQLDNGVDLAVTTDYRNILSEILSKQLRSDKLDFIFPGFVEYEPIGFL
ncbi:MAG: DUF1501 domain-containing protein [Saprospiraceae bacterium]|nr:DUF1501 domain-containing protein [Saprospiraceae bacterium]